MHGSVQILDKNHLLQVLRWAARREAISIATRGYRNNYTWRWHFPRVALGVETGRKRPKKCARVNNTRCGTCTIFALGAKMRLRNLLIFIRNSI